VVYKLKLENNICTIKWSSKLVFLNEKKYLSIFDFKNRLWKYEFGTFWQTNIHCTVVHLTNTVDTKSVPGDASHMWCMSKDFLGFIHTAIKGNIGGNLIINFTPKKQKIGKIGHFQVAWNCLKSLHIYPNQQYIMSADQK
jgi:hypothetical protein